MLKDKYTLKHEWYDWEVICMHLEQALKSSDEIVKQDKDAALALSVLRGLLVRIKKRLCDPLPFITITFTQAEMLAYHNAYTRRLIPFSITTGEIVTLLDRSI